MAVYVTVAAAIGSAAVFLFPHVIVKPVADYASAWLGKLDKTVRDSEQQAERLAKLEEEVRRSRPGVVIVNGPTSPAPEAERPSSPTNDARQEQITAILRQPSPAQTRTSPPPERTPATAPRAAAPENSAGVEARASAPEIAPQRAEPAAPPAVAMATPNVVRLSRSECVAFPAARPLTVEVRAGDVLCSANGLSRAVFDDVSPERVFYTVAGRETACRIGDLCSFNWPGAPLFRLGSASGSNLVHIIVN